MKDKTIFDELKEILICIDSLVFTKNPVILIEDGAKELSLNGFIAYFVETDSYAIHTRLKTISRENFISEITNVRSLRVLNSAPICFLDEDNRLHPMPDFLELPEKTVQQFLLSLAVHEVRHRQQMIGSLNLFKLIEYDYQKYKVFENMYSFNHYHLTKLIENGLYLPKNYSLELDAMMIEEIFIYELWLAEQNELTFIESLEQASKIISMKPSDLRERLFQVCYLGLSYFKSELNKTTQ